VIEGLESSDDDTDTIAAIGNIGRYINHSCDPNLIMVPVRVSSMVPHLALFARKKIKKGDELCFDYGDLDRETSSKMSLATDDVESEAVSKSGTNRTRCLCSSDNCVGVLPYDPQLL